MPGNASDVNWFLQELSRLGNDEEVLSEEWSWKWFEDARDNTLQSNDGRMDARGAHNLKTSDALREHRRKALLISWLSQSLQDATNKYQEDVIRQIFHHGLKRLPDEILGDICVILCDDSGSAKHHAIALGKFQLVCRRFRDVALCRVHLWSSVQDDMPVERMELQVLRCSDIGMSFHISYPKDRTNQNSDCCFCNRWEIVKKYSHRWTRGFISLGCLQPNNDHFCIEQLRMLRLPSLSMVKLKAVEDDRIWTIISSWQFPSLERFHCEGGSALTLPLLSPLKRMVLSFGTFGIRDLLSILACPASSSLTELTFKFTSVYIDDTILGFRDTVERITLGCIRKLVVMIDRTSRAEVFQLLQKLDVPNASNVSIQVHVRSASLPGFYDWLRVLGRGMATGVASVTMPLLQIAAPREIKTRIRDCLLPQYESDSEAEGGGAAMTIYVFDPNMSTSTRP